MIWINYNTKYCQCGRNAETYHKSIRWGPTTAMSNPPTRWSSKIVARSVLRSEMPRKSYQSSGMRITAIRCHSTRRASLVGRRAIDIVISKKCSSFIRRSNHMKNAGSQVNWNPSVRRILKNHQPMIQLATLNTCLVYSAAPETPTLKACSKKEYWISQMLRPSVRNSRK